MARRRKKQESKGCSLIILCFVMIMIVFGAVSPLLFFDRITGKSRYY